MVLGIYNVPENAEQHWGELKVGDINDVIEWDYTRYFCGAGTFSLIIPRTSNYADKITVGCLLITPNSTDFDGFIVKNIRYENDALKITGYDLNGLLVDRITVAKTEDGKDAQSGATETIVKHYVAANCVEAEDAERNFPALVVAEDQARGIQNDAASPRLSRISDVIADILGAAGMGYRICPDFSKSTVQFVFEVYEEVNRTDEQTDNNRAIFAYGHANITEMVRETGVTADRNTFYCELSDGLVTRYDKKTTGASDGSEAETVAETTEETTGAETSETTETTAFSGYNRREEFLELNCELSELEIYAEHEVADRYRETDSLEIVAGNPLDYGVIYNVGDIATVYDRRRDVKLNSVISAAEVKRTANEYSVKITLGNAKPKPLDLLSKNNGAVATVIRQPSGDVAKYLKTNNWILSDYDEIISFGRYKSASENQEDRSIELRCKDDFLKLSYNNTKNNVDCSIGVFSDCLMVGGSGANLNGPYQGKILEIWADGSQKFTIGACRFTFSSSGMNIYNSVMNRNIYIPFTD